MSEGAHHEIELKYLIHMPDTDLLRAQPGCEVWQIEQIYLTDGADGQTRRVRKVVSNGETSYYRTFKRRITALTGEEDEGRIDREGYEAWLGERDPELQTIEKTRYRIPYEGFLLEFDIYPFWRDRAIMEIELESEQDKPKIPDYVRIIRDVTAEKAYKNRRLAESIPTEPLPE